MSLSVKEFTENNAMKMCQWKYDSPYDIYNCPDWNTVIKENWGMANDQKRKREFFSIYNNEYFVGFFRLVKNEGYIMIALGLCPDLCGKGFGKEFMALILNTSKIRYGNTALRLEVKKFNKRAAKCYESVGFVGIDEYSRNTPTGMGDFILMECIM